MYSELTVHVRIDTLAAAGGMDISIEGQSGNVGGLPTVLLAQNFPTTGTTEINIGEVINYLRVGVAGHSGFAGTDSISIWATGLMRR
jgi:hypothetical protein